ncbi:uncharacterized protein AB675_568 [Cyphellophora attinorum]|uniref:Uncharacterized protein n=1 Tax=Cyphellophora attinorum TaxID=1664694 RepID=A0A0N1HXP5_9EURO|nr:uncharacterized protein AB675_568 [Phialophora attinorum]KPI45385.1 hypothetical protein AB675_568 [Phialophora attinorum]
MSTKASTQTITTASPESLISRLIIGPVLFISFLVSLFLVDKKIYTSIFGSDSKQGGYYHSHQRKLAKSEMDQAFQQKNRVIAGLCMASGVAVAVVLWGIGAAWMYLGRRAGGVAV